MIYNIYDGAVAISSIDEGDIEFPYEVSNKLIFKNEGTKAFVNVFISVEYGISVRNFSSPGMIADAKIINYNKPKKKYFELLMKETGKVADMANYPNRVIDVIKDEEGWSHGIIEDIAIKFNHQTKGGNSSLYYSDAKFMAAVAKDNNSSEGTYSNSIFYDIIYPGQEVPFWYKLKLKENSKGEINPRIFNLIIKGDEE